MRGIVPDVVRWRTDKGNLSGPFVQAMLQERGTVRDVIQANRGDIGAYVDLNRLRSIFSRFEATPDADAAFVLWRVVVLALWLDAGW